MSTSTAGVLDVAILVAWALAGLCALRAIRGRLSGIEASSEPVSDKVHRLQRLLLICLGWMLAT
jgi:hypothetical protein